MISPTSASAILSVANGLLKLGRRMDSLLAERTATGAHLTLPMPIFQVEVSIIAVKNHLLNLLADDHQVLIPSERTAVQSAVNTIQDDAAPARRLFKKYFPEKADGIQIDPDAEYLLFIAEHAPSIDLNDPNVRSAAFYISTGKDFREISYIWRSALLVADVFAEYAVESSLKLSSDSKTQELLKNILRRFSEPDLESFTQWSTLTRSVLNATLNGLLDSKGELGDKEPWINALFEALHEARGEDSDFLLGLFQGKGYKQLLSKGMEEAAELLSKDQANGWKLALGDTLTKASELVATTGVDFEDFFKNHWGDIFRASIGGIAKHGELILANDSELLKETLVSVLTKLSTTPNAELLDADISYTLADAALSAVAAKPELISGGINESWFQELVSSTLQVLGRQGIEKTFSKDGFSAVFSELLLTTGEHPEWIIQDPGIAQKIMGGVITQLASVKGWRADEIGQSVVSGALVAISENPQLLNTTFADLLGSYAGAIAEVVNRGGLSAFDAKSLMDSFVIAVKQNPKLLADGQTELAKLILTGTASATEGMNNDHALILRGILVSLVGETLQQTALFGGAIINNQVNDILNSVKGIVQGGITLAVTEIGKQIGSESLSPIIAGLIVKWARGDLSSIDPNSDEFKTLFEELEKKANLRAA